MDHSGVGRSFTRVFRSINHLDFPRDYSRNILRGSTPQPPSNDENEDFSRPETPPARHSPHPLGYDDEDGLEYAEDEIEIRSDFFAPPDHAALTSEDSVFNRSGAELRITSDTGVLFPPSDEELARISKEFKREAIDFASGLDMQPPADPSRPRHPLAQSYIPSSPEIVPRPGPQQLVAPHPIPRTPSPSRTVLGGKRKRASTPEEEAENNVAGPSAAVVHPNVNGSRHIEARNNEGRLSSKRRRLITRQPTWDFQMFVDAGYAPAPPPVDPPTRENSPELSSQPAHRQASPPSIATSQLQKEDSEIEKSQVVGTLSQEVEQARLEDEGQPTGNTLGNFGDSRRSLPALIADNTGATSTNTTQSEAKTPIESQVPAEVQVPVPEDVFGPIVLSVKANKISDRFPTKVFTKDADGDVEISEFEHGAINVSSKSTRFSLDGGGEREGRKVFRKTPIRLRTSLRVTEVENALAAEVETESRDMLEPLQSPKKKRVVDTRARKPKSTRSIAAKLTATNPGNGFLSISAIEPPSKPKRGRSASVQPEGPALPKTPVKKSTRGRK